MSKQYVIPLYNCLEISKQPINNNMIERVDYVRRILSNEIESDLYNQTHPTLNVSMDSSTAEVTNVEIKNLDDYETYVTTMSGSGINITYIKLNFDIIASVGFIANTIDLRVTNVQYVNSSSGWQKKEYEFISVDEINDVSDLTTSGSSLFSGVIYEIRNESRIKGQLFLSAQAKLSDETIYRINTYNVKLTATQLVERTENVYIGEKNIENSFTMETNELLHILENNPILATDHHLAENILTEYENGKQTIELTVVTNKYYDINGNLILNHELGKIPRIGDTFYLMSGGKNNFNYSHTNNILYKITSSEFNYNGVPKVVIKAKAKEV